MATGEPGGSSSISNRSVAVMEASISKVMEELEEMKIQAGKEEVCKEDPNASSNATLSSLKRVKLMLESELEALQDTPLFKLPSDPTLLQELATEDMQRAANESARTLAFYKKTLEEVKEEKKDYEIHLKRATVVNQNLDRLLTHYLSDEEKFAVLERKYNRASVVFRFLREQMHFILTSLYPSEMSSPESIKSMEDLLDNLVSRMMQQPNEPYVKLDDTMDEAHISLLLSANLISRHPTDITSIKFIDPRV